MDSRTHSRQLEHDAAAGSARYKNRLRYLPNQEFSGEISAIGVSVPNTFKHKSHPNAKTKEHIGMPLLAESRPELPPMKTSTLNKEMPDFSRCSNDSGANATNGAGGNDGPQDNESTGAAHTPSWMPSELRNEALEENPYINEPGTSRGPRGSPGELDFLGASSNTFIHNQANGSVNQPHTPMWKRMSAEYQRNHAANHDKLQSIFHNSRLNSHLHTGSGKDQYGSWSSGFSTPVASKDADIHLTQHQIHQLEDILEKARDKPDDYQIKGLPLKLFGNEYDTFTKVFLSRFVDKVRSNANSVQRTENSKKGHNEKNDQKNDFQELPAPRLKVRSFSRAGDYSNHDFMNNANSLFAQIQRKRPSFHPATLPDNSATASPSFQPTLEQNTVTSTPKAEKTRDLDVIASVDEYLSFSTDFDQNSSAESHHPTHNDYTSIDKTYLSQPRVGLDSAKHDGSSYTYTDISEEAATQNGFHDSMSSVRRHARQISDKIPDKKISDKKIPEDKVISGNSGNSEINSRTECRKEPEIQWKNPSQLRLIYRESVKPKKPMGVSDAGNKPVRPTKGMVKPGNYPLKYGNMVFDSEHQRWVSAEHNSGHVGSLDSIESLTVEDEEEEAENIAEKSNSVRRKNPEVSFNLPSDIHADANATGVSEIGNVTFTQTHKRLVSLITDAVQFPDWESVSEISLSDSQLESVDGLAEFLPALKKANLSKNYIKFLGGIPSGILELDLTDNFLGDLTSFKQFHDLHALTVASNSLNSISGLSSNIHLTRLDVSNNNIRNLTGMGSLQGLQYLKLAQNSLSGTVDFGKIDAPALQELDLSENKISAVENVHLLPKLRILNINENKLQRITCSAQHRHLKKLLVKFNRLRKLHLHEFPFLRVVRFDGNDLEEITDLSKLKLLQEVSAKCQSNSAIAKGVFEKCVDVVKLDISGNGIVRRILGLPQVSTAEMQFLNVNELDLSAVGLTSIGDDFGDLFCNVRYLNLNFNNISEITGLKNLHKLRRLHLLSNNLDSMETVLGGLCNARKLLRCLDLRLNSVNFDFYPYVFNPLERQIAPSEDKANSNSETSPIQLDALDDIENFSIHYNSMMRSKEEWAARDGEFVETMRREGNANRFEERLNYERILVAFLPHLRELDGGVVNESKRRQLTHARG